MGVISELKEGGEPCPAYEIRKAMKKHSELGLHNWCVQRDVVVRKETKTFEEENKEVGKMVVLTYLRNAQHSRSFADFLNDINITHLHCHETIQSDKGRWKICFALWHIHNGVLHQQTLQFGPCWRTFE